MTFFSADIGALLNDGSIWSPAGVLIVFPRIAGETLDNRTVQRLYRRMGELQMEATKAKRPHRGRPKLAGSLEPGNSSVITLNVGPTIRGWYKSLNPGERYRIRAALLTLLENDARSAEPPAIPDEVVRGHQLQFRAPEAPYAAYAGRNEADRLANRNALIAYLVEQMRAGGTSNKAMP